MQALTGHTSPETAYVVEDYPYGFRLRCQMRHWLEYKKGHGFRHVTQTSNPKKPGLVWNKPKTGTYAPCIVLALNAEGHVTTIAPEWPRDEAAFDAFEQEHGHAFTDEHKRAMTYLRAVERASKRVTWTVRAHDPANPGQTLQEQADIFGAVVRDELRKATV
jgi:hypothetical protein